MVDAGCFSNPFFDWSIFKRRHWVWAGVGQVGLEMDPGNWQFSGLKHRFWQIYKHRPWGGFWVYPVTYLIILSSCEFRMPNRMGLHGLSEKLP